MRNGLCKVVMTAVPIIGAAVIYVEGPAWFAAAVMVGALIVASVFARSWWDLAYIAVWAFPALAVVLFRAHEFFYRESGLRDLGYTEGHVMTVTTWAVVAAVAWVLLDAVWTFFRRERTSSESQPRKRRRSSMRELAVARTTDENQVFFLKSGPGRSAVVVGVPGSGKSGAFWSIFEKLLPWYDQGLVRFHGIDPKTGIELRKAEPVFDTLIWEDPRVDDPVPFGQRVAEFLEGVVAEIKLTAAELGDIGEDKLEPTPERPWNVILADELLMLTAFMQDAYRARISEALGIILTQGRASGWWVIAASQEANADSVGAVIRQFQMRLCLRMATRTAVDVALGPGVRTEYGADAHKIPDSEPGVGYVFDAENNRVAKVRFNHVTKEDIAKRMLRYGTPDNVPEVGSEQFGEGVEVETGETQPATPSMVDRIITSWPRFGSGAPYANVHVADLASLLEIAETDVTDGLSAAGVPTSVIQRRPVGSGRDAAKVRAPGVSWADLEPFAA